jgi:hypothetical protein
MIEIKMLTEAALKTLQTVSEEVAKMINDHPSDSSWLKNYLGFDPFEIKKYQVEDFSLNDDASSEGQFNNAVILYNAFKGLPKYIVCDTRFWGWVILEKGYKLSQNLINVTKGTVKSRWFNNTSRRSLMLNALGRLYFKVDISVDETKEDKYELTRYIFSHHNIYKNLTFRNIGMIKNVSLAILSVHKEVHEKYPTVILDDDVDSPLLNEASKIGSVKLIDTLTKNEIYEILKPKFYKMISDKANKKKD